MLKMVSPNKNLSKFIKRWFSWIYSLFFLVLIIIIVFRLFPFYKEIIITENVLFWTFSTIVQGFMGLLAFFGMVGIFRTELLERKLDQIVEKARSFVMYFRGSPAEPYIQEELIEELDKINNEKRMSSSHLTQVKILNTRIKNIINRRNVIKDAIIKFAEVTLFTICTTHRN